MSDETPTTRGHISTPGDVLRVIWRRLWTIVLVAVVITGSALAFSLAQTPTYQASILIAVGQETPDSPDEAARGGSLVDAEQLVATAATAIDAAPVAQGAVERLNLPGGEVPAVLAGMEAAAQPGTTFVEVTYTDTDPRQAQLIANAIGEEFSELAPTLNAGNTPMTAQLWQRAALPGAPASPNLPLNTGLALVIGILFGTMLAFVFEYLDDNKATQKRGVFRRK